MDKRNDGITKVSDYIIQLNDGRRETTRNRVITLNDDFVEIIVSKKYLVTIDTEYYCNNMLWANRLDMGHADIRKGVVSMQTGYAHLSVPAKIMNTQDGQKVSYKDGNRFNLRKSNLYIRGKANAVVAEG